MSCQACSKFYQSWLQVTASLIIFPDKCLQHKNHETKANHTLAPVQRKQGWYVISGYKRIKQSLFFYFLRLREVERFGLRLLDVT